MRGTFDFDPVRSDTWSLEKLTGGMVRSEKEQESGGKGGSTRNGRKWKDEYYWAKFETYNQKLTNFQKHAFSCAPVLAGNEGQFFRGGQ